MSASDPPQVLMEVFDGDPAPFKDELDKSDLSSAIAPDLASLPTSRAVLLIPGTRRFVQVQARLEAIWRQVLDAGSDIVIASPVTDIDIYSLATKAFEGRRSSIGDLTESIVAVLPDDPRKVANWIASRHRRRPPRNSLIIRPKGLIDPGDALLFQRSFNDFDNIKLTKLFGGKTSSAYRVDAFQVPNRRPLPFLAKVAERRKIVEEYDNFVDNVADNVPFSWRPNLIRERCLVGSDRGILVGQFIEHSVPLSEVCQRGAVSGVLHAVFYNLLQGWWRLGERDTDDADKSVLFGLESWFDHSTKPERIAALNKHYAIAHAEDSTVLFPIDMRARLYALTPRRHRRSLIHGDLHDGNVHVRGTDVYLIDFGSVAHGPILADAAMLEASLVLSTGVACKTKKLRQRWERLTATGLYASGWSAAPGPPEPPIAVDAVLRRLWEAVRVIRLHAMGMQLSQDEYAILVAAALVRVAAFDDKKPKERTARVAHLYAIASRIVGGLH